MTTLEVSTMEVEVERGRIRPATVGELLRAPFRAVPRWMVWYVWFWGLALFALMIWSAASFFGAETERGMIAWAAGFVASTVGVVWVKAWWWMTANRALIERDLEGLTR